MQTNIYGQTVGRPLPGFTPGEKPEISRIDGKWCSVVRLKGRSSQRRLRSAISR